MAELVDDVLEKIMIGFDVKDLTRFKCVCKSWNSFLSSPRFVNSHMDHTSTNNNKTEHNRIVMCHSGCRTTYGYKFPCDCHLVGSSNGLVCISPSSDAEITILIVNPSIRELKKLPNPRVPNYIKRSIICWGFGYDSLMDDYKVLLGFMKGKDKTCFQLVFSLKSNEWKDIGSVKYRFITRFGILYNGSIHWFMNDRNKKRLIILSFNLSEEEFNEVPQPDDARYKSSKYNRLGIIKDCLCVFSRLNRGFDKWVMRKYGIKESWEVLQSKWCRKMVTDNIPKKNYLFHDYRVSSMSCKYIDAEYISAPIFAVSLVSPHVNGRPRKNKYGHEE